MGLERLIKGELQHVLNGGRLYANLLGYNARLQKVNLAIKKERLKNYVLRYERFMNKILY